MNELLGLSIGDRIAADFVVMGVALITWGGLFAYLVGLDKRVRKLREKQ